MNRRCLYCYKELGSEFDFHSNCSKSFFGKSIAPELPYTEEQILELAEKIIKSHTTVTGVQPKLSLEIEKITKENTPKKFTLVGLWGSYILKPPTQQYPNLPELEDVTMHLAEVAEITTVPHSLIRLKSGKLSYITRRIDRTPNGKLHMEDMCQLTERLTEYKYKGSYEQIGKVIVKYSANPGLDIINFFEQVVFSFLTGNADMHLKNFSLVNQPHIGYILSPAYDLVASAFVVKGDNEELALNLNGKKKKIRRKDFIEAMTLFSVQEKAMLNIFNKFNSSIESWDKLIEISFLPDKIKSEYKELIKLKAHQIGLL